MQSNPTNLNCRGWHGKQDERRKLTETGGWHIGEDLDLRLKQLHLMEFLCTFKTVNYTEITVIYVWILWDFFMLFSNAQLDAWDNLGFYYMGNKKNTIFFHCDMRYHRILV